ncbi:peptidase M23 [Tropicibacter sp. R16_0]|uniref:peptidase M23 n=1 Tax=Tropicibacter sp. R16_0 TaxID=2821102 RepID=UPI001ADBAEA2|nr:peptidase M23 [Tropicibacter sp. R16_0]MBO9452981.1 peptidase M23 [Tropicibacter sp. R16_0]
MKYVLTPVAALTAMPAFAHSGAHLHPHGSEAWLAVVLAAVTVVSTITFVRHRIGKGPRR